ncbi:MAG: hypothetical protein H7Y30_13100 [Pyrinomonadaceae bacterium]|nr:hypothetical protein [Pyrinomonadaceae bacterium]
MKSHKPAFTFALAFAAVLLLASASNANAQFGDMLDRAKGKTKEAQPKTETKPQPVPEAQANNDKDAKGDAANSSDPSNTQGSDETAKNKENAKRLAQAPGMPKAANTDAALIKLLHQAADDHRLIPRRVVITDKDWIIVDNARGGKTRRIFAVLARTKDDGSGNCAKQMVQFDSNWRPEKNEWGHPYVQNIGEIVPLACNAVGK